MFRYRTLPIRTVLCSALTAGLYSAALTQDNLNYHKPSGTNTTSWIGNSFGGNGGPNGQGYWVQQGASKIDVSADGTVLAGVGWDEAGRCAGLYKDGKVNRLLLRVNSGKGGESAWGWGTGNDALTVDGNRIYIANTGKRLLRFKWTPGDLESASFLDEVELPEKAIGLNARGDHIIVVYAGSVELRKTTDLSVEKQLNVAGARDAVIMPDGGLWVLSDKTVKQYSAEGAPTGRTLQGLGNPSAIALGHDGRFIVCDDGRDQQVKFFDVKGEPRLSGVFGEKGGIASSAGKVASKRLFGLRGAGTDSWGNLYVAMGFTGGPQGNLFLRSFTPAGVLRWELHSAAFVDCYSFDPASDGKVVYSRAGIWDLDLTRSVPGKEATLRSITMDPVTTPPNDPRRIDTGTALLRHVGGRRILYMMQMMGGGYRLYGFNEPGDLAREVGKVTGEDAWAWDVEQDGHIWWGDAPQRTIRRIAFRGWKSDGSADYAIDKPQSWPWPEGIERVNRTLYDPKSDSLYLFCYLKGEIAESWGVIGTTARRYDGWLKGNHVLRWSVKMPINPKGSEKGGPLTAKSVALAGDYMFVGMVKDDGPGQHYTHIYQLKDGSYAGSLKPDSEAVGDGFGWIDMVTGVQAIRRSNGEYLVLIEEDWRGKNLLYRWKPGSVK